MIIELSWSELMIAALVGVMRCVKSKYKGYENKHGLQGPGWNQDIQGACGELAVAKYLNVFWDGTMDSFTAGADVQGLQVRSTDRDGRLIIRPTDPDDAVFILARGGPLEWEIAGWILGRDGKQEEFCGDPTGNRPAAYFVPIHALRPMELMPREVCSGKHG